MTNSGGRWIPGPYQNMPGNYPSGVSMGPGNIPKNFPGMMYPPGNMIPQVRFFHIFPVTYQDIIYDCETHTPLPGNIIPLFHSPALQSTLSLSWSPSIKQAASSQYALIFQTIHLPIPFCISNHVSITAQHVKWCKTSPHSIIQHGTSTLKTT